MEKPGTTGIELAFGLREEWVDQSACKTLGGHVDFYPPEQVGRRPDDYEPYLHPAQKICASCPVITECLDYALAKPEHNGIWGGLTERQRRSLRRRSLAAQREVSDSLVSEIDGLVSESW